MKREKKETNTLVVVGNWNIAIFTPEWVQNNILDNGWEAKIYYPSLFGCSLKFETKWFSFNIEGDRLIFTINNGKSDDSFVNIVKTFRKIIQRLPHTPIKAMGTNYVYEIEGHNDTNATADKTNDFQKRLALSVGHDLNSYSQLTNFKISSKEELNIRINCNSTPNTFDVDFNFNYTLSSISEIMEIIGEQDSLLLDNRKRALDIISDVYGE